MVTPAKTAPARVRDRIRLILLAIYGVSVAAMLWCYFGIPAPGRWPFVVRGLVSWIVLLRGR
jgi:hypothetical protein